MTKSVEVHLIRHATGTHMVDPSRIIGRALDATLTEAGQQEALMKGIELHGSHFRPDAVYSSPAIRCLETGRLVMEGLGISQPMTTTDLLIEMDQGRNAGKLRTDVYTPETVARIKEQGKDFAPEEGESMNDVGRRGLMWLHSLEQYASRDAFKVMAFTHTGFIACTVGMLRGYDQAETRALFPMTPPTGEVTISFEDGVWRA